MDWVNRYEVDTRPPFRSVKDAVSLFGERFLAGEGYTAKTQEACCDGNGDSKIGEIMAELEETKQNLEKAREKVALMASSLTSLQEELDRTKNELHKLKKHESWRRMESEKEAEDVKFIESWRSFETDNVNETEFQKRRYVTFASPPMLEQTVVPRCQKSPTNKHKPLDKNKKKTLLPLIGRILHKQKQEHEVASATAAASGDW
ncbi:hypothetical protein MLD38_024813 [Melastoma candidum]|uniref:Uncharacterized protein n=1 Tax=Melastoma candidum TaxID=119954 RepID=A0ACB9NT72_9MYRT|nr:hypothetical protein MLD38_024813 [Melastoma candidum]